MADSRNIIGQSTNSIATAAVANSQIAAERNYKDSSAVKKFYEEYQNVLKNARFSNHNLSLMDILEQLRFIDEDILRPIYQTKFQQK